MVLGMKVKTCVNSPYLNNNGWGKVGCEFPRIYVWIVARSKEKNVTLVICIIYRVSKKKTRIIDVLDKFFKNLVLFGFWA